MKLKKKILKISLILLALISVSCASRKDVIYFQDINKVNSTDKKFTPPKFKIDDRLTINITSINQKAAAPFNLYLAAFNTGGLSSQGNQQQQSYLVDLNGEISFPQLGKIKVAGKNRVELEKYIEDQLKLYLPDAKANVQLVNFRISVLGEVKSPGEYIVNRDKVSILQAIGLAGDLSIHAKRNDVKIIRENNGKFNYYNIDLRSVDVVNSEAFYLQQNDVVYVSPNKPRVNASASSPTASYLISATGLLVTIISILTR